MLGWLKKILFKTRKRHEGMGLRANVHFSLKDENGQIKQERTVHNLVVTQGERITADLMLPAPASGNPISGMAVGTDGTAAASGNTALGAELARAALTGTNQAAGASATTNLYTCTFTAGIGTGNLQEAGMFDTILLTAATGLLFSRVTFAAINKQAGDTLDVNWYVKFADDAV